MIRRNFFIVSLAIISLGLFFACEVIAKESLDKKEKDHVINLVVKDIPQNQQTLYIPLNIDVKVFDVDKVSLEGLSSQNILAVASTSKDKVGPGVGILKLDNKGLPSSLELKVFLKPVGSGKTDVTLNKVADEPALLARGAKIKADVKVSVESGSEIQVQEEEKEGKKKLRLSTPKLTLNIERQNTRPETIFIPIIFDKTVLDLDETFGHAIVAPGIALKSFSSGSLHEGGPGVEIVLSEASEKNFKIDVDLIAKGQGTSKVVAAYPQEGHTAVVKGPVVEINPSTISFSSPTVKSGE